MNEWKMKKWGLGFYVSIVGLKTITRIMGNLLIYYYYLEMFCVRRSYVRLITRRLNHAGKTLTITSAITRQLGTVHDRRALMSQISNRDLKTLP